MVHVGIQDERLLRLLRQINDEFSRICTKKSFLWYSKYLLCGEAKSEWIIVMKSLTYYERNNNISIVKCNISVYYRAVDGNVHNIECDEIMMLYAEVKLFFKKK